MPTLHTAAGNRIEATAADVANAERFITEAFDNDRMLCRRWLANNRPSLLRQATVAEAQKRQHREHRDRALLETAGLPQGEVARVMGGELLEAAE